ncbi:uncharacterized protein BDV14DRAFT_190515 [Aspergillus stella-maris]|uniref:uncharacterized protein n=1 Tax=Aspergillus stella-maris TaxID=1810926 RepID=UPI003CCCB01A
MAVDYEYQDSEMERAISDPDRGFLGHLAPSVIPHYQYQGPEQFLRDFEREHNPSKQTDHWFLLTGVTQRIFNEHFSQPESGPFSRGCAFDSDLKCLLVAMPESTTHSAAAMIFTKMVSRAARSVWMEDGLDEMGSGGHTSKVMGAKQPDMAWRPERKVPGRDNHWPSMVLEVALSETRAKLQSDARYWLRAPPGGAVKIILTLIIKQRKEEIIIERWEHVRAQGSPHLQQQVVISRRRSNVTFTGSPLVIGFNNLFLRPPLTPEEVDLQLDNEKLQLIAEKIWKYQRENSIEPRRLN